MSRWEESTLTNEQTVSLSLRELHWLLDGLSYLQTEAHTVVSGLKNK
ncbi:hypothetical protein [Bathymodiolus platifrons methanotrophic gill symbiont]|nr:hypothetical protein [Bathymodiolus platifrons methanotrophic gill symbiont]